MDIVQINLRNEISNIQCDMPLEYKANLCQHKLRYISMLTHNNNEKATQE